MKKQDYLNVRGLKEGPIGLDYMLHMGYTYRKTINVQQQGYTKLIKQPYHRLEQFISIF